MELRHLRYFDAVATERNFTRAAARVGVAQPPLSRQIRELEDELGVALFDRTSRPIRLTEAGRLFYDQCARILVSVDQLRDSIRHLQSSSRRLFIVGVVGSIMHGALPAMIRGFREQLPEVEVELIEMTTVDQVAALKDGRVDAGLGRIRIDDPGIRREILYEEPLIAALPAGHPLAKDTTPVRLAELREAVLILYPSHPRPSYADQLLGLFRDYGGVPEKVREVREVQTALGLVAAQAGVAVVPFSMRHVQLADIVYRPIADAGAHSPVILSQRLSDDSQPAQSFRGIGRNAFASVGDGTGTG